MSGLVTLGERRSRQLDVVDRMSPSLRACVHDFGLPIVTVLTKFGIRDPRHIREIVREIWLGPRQDGQRSDTLGTIDFMLSHGPMSLRTLRRMLAENNQVIVSVEPTRAMLDASMEAVSDHTVRCTKEEKHRRRLRAALRAVLDRALEEAGGQG